MELKLKSGETIQFEEFTPKESNLIKVRLHHNEGDGEGIWACIDDKDKADYDVRDSKPTRVATLRNSAIMFYPNDSWGCIIPVRFDGEKRPECNVDWIADDSDMIFNTTETLMDKTEK